MKIITNSTSQKKNKKKTRKKVAKRKQKKRCFSFDWEWRQRSQSWWWWWWRLRQYYTHHCISSGFITDGQHLPHLLLLLLEHRSASHELVPHFFLPGSIQMASTAFPIISLGSNSWIEFSCAVTSLARKKSERCNPLMSFHLCFVLSVFLFCMLLAVGKGRLLVVTRNGNAITVY